MSDATPTGKPRQVTRTVKGGKRAASKALAELETETGAGKHGTSRTAATTVDAVIESHIANLERLGRSPMTTYTYRAYARTVIGPEIGAKSVRTLTARDLDALYGRMASRGASEAVVRKVHVVLSGALGQAVTSAGTAVLDDGYVFSPKSPRRIGRRPTRSPHAVFQRGSR